MNHEAINDAMKNRAIVVAIGDVGQKVLSGGGRFVLIEFDRDDAMVSNVQFNLWVCYGMYFSKVAFLIMTVSCGTSRGKLLGTAGLGPVGNFLMALTTSMPSTTRPKAA